MKTSVEKNLKKLDLSQRTPIRSINDVLACVINELECFSSCLGYRAKHPKLLMNSFIVDHESLLFSGRSKGKIGKKRVNSIIQGLTGTLANKYLLQLNNKVPRAIY